MCIISNQFLILKLININIFKLLTKMGKVHGSLARAGKVKGQTEKIKKTDKKKPKTGRAKKRLLYNRRFHRLMAQSKYHSRTGRGFGPNSSSSQEEKIVLNISKKLHCDTAQTASQSIDDIDRKSSQNWKRNRSVSINK